MESGFWIFLADLDVGVKEEEHVREGGEGEAQREADSVLQELSRSRTEPQCVVQRAAIMVLAFEGRWNQEIATEVELHPQQVGTWRQRWRDSWEALGVWECHEPRRLREAPV